MFAPAAAGGDGEHIRGVTIITARRLGWPKHADNEQTLEQVRARIRKTIAFAEGVKESQYAEAAERKVSMSWAPGKVIGGEDYLLQIAIPNIFFHIAMAYAVLRHNGVDVGKMDFLGPINWVDP